MLTLLDEYRVRALDGSVMYELQMKIESISLENFTDPSIAYRRFPGRMSRLVQNDKI